MIGVRENDRAAQAFGVSPVRAKLTAFAASGFIAAFAGAVFVHHQQRLGIEPYATEESLAVFSMVVIGGLGSLSGAILGAVYVIGAQYFLPAELSFFVGGAGLLIVLLALPGGLGLAALPGPRRAPALGGPAPNIMVPSLFADAKDHRRVGLSRQRGMAFLRDWPTGMDGAGAEAGWRRPPARSCRSRRGWRHPPPRNRRPGSTAAAETAPPGHRPAARGRRRRSDTGGRRSGRARAPTSPTEPAPAPPPEPEAHAAATPPCANATAATVLR